MKATSPREEKGRENRGAVVAAASGGLKIVNGGNGLGADGGDSTGNTETWEIDWRELSSTESLAMVRLVVAVSAAGSCTET